MAWSKSSSLPIWPQALPAWSCLIDRGALDLQEEAVLLAVRVVIQQIERLVMSLSEEP